MFYMVSEKRYVLYVSEKRYVLNVRHFKFKFQKGSLNLTYVPVIDWYH